MPLNQPAGNVHRLDKINLLAIRGQARIFPDQSFAIREKSIAVALP
jgi:hypothetical protein